MRYFAVVVGFAFATAMFAASAAQAQELQKNSAGKCWVNTDKTNYKWGDCPQEKQATKKGDHAKKG
jgi:hypothetical protein